MRRVRIRASQPLSLLINCMRAIYGTILVLFGHSQFTANPLNPPYQGTLELRESRSYW